MDRPLDTVMCDLDSTLCDTRHRHYLAPEDPIHGDWTAFSIACIGDAVIEGTAILLRMLHPNYRIVFVSGRNYTAHANTVTWLAINHIPYDELYLCNYNETPIPNGELKAMHIKKQRERGFNPVLFLEDWIPSAETIEAARVPVLCVNPRYTLSDRIAPAPRLI